MNCPKRPSIYDNVSRVPRERCWCGANLLRYHCQRNYGLCPSCGTFVLMEVPDPRFFKEIYSLDNYWRYRQKEIKGHPTIEERTLNDLQDGRVSFWLDLVHQYAGEPGVTVEVGCGHGVLLGQLKSEGWTTIGVEVGEGTAHWVCNETGLDIRTGTFPEMLLPPCRLFLAMDVIEHVYEPVPFAMKIGELLTPGGVAVIQTPLYDGTEDPPFGNRFSDVFDDIEHLFVFNRKSISQLFERAGLTVLSNELAWQPCHEVIVVSKSPSRRSEKTSALPGDNDLSGGAGFPASSVSLGKVTEIETGPFRSFMRALNSFADRWGLRQFVDWSKIWEYPWLWFNGLSHVNWKESTLLDIGSELSPMPWFLASLGANVTLAETDQQWVSRWKKIVDESGFDVKWKIVSGEVLPFADDSFDVVTSFSVIEHQRDKGRAVDELVRILAPGGLFAVSFDICEPERGMTFPDWNGHALTTEEFEKLIWDHPDFGNERNRPPWNFEDCEEFIRWHLHSAPHHNYVVGASLLRKGRGPRCPHSLDRKSKEEV